MTPPDPLTILIASPLEPELVQRIKDAEPERARVLYAPDLLPLIRYRNDHGGAKRELTTEERRHWRELLAQADVCFDFDWEDPANLLQNAPNLRWIQATSSGIKGFVDRYAIPPDRILLTTAAGVHAQPLAEFALLGMLYFTRELPRLRTQQQEHFWERYCGRELRGSTALLLGLGHVGRRVAQLAACAGVRVVATRRSAEGDIPPGVERVVPLDQLDSVLPQADFLVIALPGTPETENLISRERLEALKAGAVIVNVGRGTVVDEPAMIELLQSGRLGGAALDVFAVEPLPSSSPLWDMPNVIVSPHSMSTVEAENERIVELFIENLHRFLAGEPLINVYGHERGY
jgi:phosphoglycerate dehydrogenase-like enzyme